MASDSKNLDKVWTYLRLSSDYVVRLAKNCQDTQGGIRRSIDSTLFYMKRTYASYKDDLVKSADSPNKLALLRELEKVVTEEFEKEVFGDEDDA